ncbi:hypothetical protein [Leptolyngbya ohadii]|uniref:hypothetical protein n=1 Tax=Leptolyngbya ohadii TaxID=1962290 RepID=UPI000B599818|nr:hypothetical protein [Leptolyngbya ohadii]
MRHHYPKGTEYELLWEEIQLRYFTEADLAIEPLHQASRRALLARDIERYTDIARLIQVRQSELYQRRWRGEEILQWLWLDSELRKAGKTYPDVCEKPDVVCSADEF